MQNDQMCTVNRVPKAFNHADKPIWATELFVHAYMKASYMKCTLFVHVYTYTKCKILAGPASAH